MQKIIYIKIAKNGGTSMVDYFNQFKNLKHIYLIDELEVENIDINKINEANIISLANLNTIRKFKEIFNEIYQKSNKLIIFRDPIDRVLSSYNYLNFKDTLLNVLKTPPKPCEKGVLSKNPKYIHFTLEQMYASDIDLEIFKNKFYKIIDFKNINTDIKKYMIDMGYEEKNIPKKNITNYKTKKINLEEMKLIEKLFSNDLIIYKKIKNEL